MSKTTEPDGKRLSGKEAMRIPCARCGCEKQPIHRESHPGIGEYVMGPFTAMGGYMYCEYCLPVVVSLVGRNAQSGNSEPSLGALAYAAYIETIYGSDDGVYLYGKLTEVYRKAWDAAIKVASEKATK